jgi:acetyl-CoA carboxylase biotin carboxyl carrier protein
LLKASDIEEILRLVDSSDFSEVRLQLGDTKLEWRRGGAAPSAPASVVAREAARQATPTPPLPQKVAAPAINDGSTAVPSPMLGIFWHAPRPGDAPFVKVGDTVKPDSLIGIIEVMKLMNTVPAGIAGVITDMAAPNGKGVEFGQTLIRVRPI